MRTMIGISLLIHVLLLLHISGIYRSKTLSYIELTMHDISKPIRRSIPRPRMRHECPKIVKEKKLTFNKRRVPVIKNDPVKNVLQDTLMEDIGLPDVSENAAFGATGWASTGPETIMTAGDYFEIVKIKIENSKIYPESAESSHIEGRVLVGFMITMDGEISSLKIVKPSYYDILNAAALDAVQHAAPFPIPPSTLFKKPLLIEISISFELP